MKLIFFLFAVLLSMFAFGQNDVIKSEACDTTLTYWPVQILPEYKGGNEKLLQDLNTNLILDESLTGTFRIDFLINCKGKSSGYKIESDFGKEFENNFTKVFSELQKWKAGKYNNENVDCSYTLILQIDNGIIKNSKNNRLGQ